MGLNILFWDELKGFYKSRIMIILWLGLPVITLLMHYFRPQNDQQMSLTFFSMLIVASLCSTLASIMLAVNIIHEKSKGVYPLFLVRPVKRSHILLSKFFAVFFCITVAVLFNIALGLIVDKLNSVTLNQSALGEALKSMATGFIMMGISSSAGLLIGVLSPSVVMGVILVLYGGNQLAGIALIPAMLQLPIAFELTILAGCIFTLLLVFLAIYFFNKKQF